MPYKYKLNPITGELDLVSDLDTDSGDLRYLKLDFSNLPTSGANGFVENGNTLELWWNGTLIESWTVTPTITGKPIGLLLSLTYA